MQPHLLARAVSKILSEKRDNERVKAAFSAIVSEDGEFRCHCIIRDVSENGMRLEFPDTPKMPEFFEIRTPAMPEILEVRCAWQRHKLMGVEFVVTEDALQEKMSGAA